MRRSGPFHLECARCATTREAEGLIGLCSCGGPWLVRYALDALAPRFRREALGGRPWDLWRYREVLPLLDGESPVTLGEGGTPLLPAQRLGPILGPAEVWIKDEAENPTGTFKARGLAVAVTRAARSGARSLVMASAGNAGAALAAYAARAGLKARIYLPADTFSTMLQECRSFGAEVILVDGPLPRCAREAQRWAAETGAFDVSTLREPYRVEGKKTMAYEIVEQLNGGVPDVIVYPTGGGTGVIGMWKAFAEMRALGWIGDAMPRLVCVQATGCAPIVKAWEQGSERAEPWENPRTIASGLCVPSALGDFLILRAIRESAGAAVAVPDGDLLQGARALATLEGVAACPEGGATIAALPALVRSGAVRPRDRVVCFNTGSAVKYLPHIPALERRA